MIQTTSIEMLEELKKVQSTGQNPRGFRVLIDWKFKPGQYTEVTTAIMKDVAFHMAIPVTAKGFRVFARCYAFKPGANIEDIDAGDTSMMIPPGLYSQKIQGLAVCEVHVVNRLTAKKAKVEELQQTNYPTRFMELTTKIGQA